MHNDSLQLKNRVAVVTGGSRGIGRAVCNRFAEMGARVVVNYVSDEEAANEVVEAAQGRGVEAIAFRADVSKLGDAENLVQATVEQFERLDFLICNAGIWSGGPVEEITNKLWDATVEINLKGTWSVCRAAVPQMKEQQHGRIVIVSSTAGQRGEAGYSNYAASKGGQIAFMKSLASELAPFGIAVNAVAPGWVDTEMTEEELADEEARRAAVATIPLGRIATPDEIAWPIVFLCSDWAGYINGEVINVNGGSVLCG